MRVAGEDSTHTLEGLQRRHDLAELEPLTTAGTTEQPPTATPAATTTDAEQGGFVYVPVNLPSSSLPKAGAEGVAGKQRVHADDGNFDFVDSPLGDKVLVPAGSSPSQSSRVNVKKGPNGQDYEYEYVYYYYDEDEDEGATAAPNGAAGTTGSAGSNSVYTPPLVSQTPLKTAPSPSPAPVEAAFPQRPNYSSPPRFFNPTEAPGLGASAQPENEADQDDEAAVRPSPAVPASRNRYTSIERTTAEPASNEVLPTGPRSR